MKDEINLVIINRRIRLLGIIITVGIVVIYIMGLLLPLGMTESGMEMLNLVTLIVAVILCPASVFVKNSMLSMTRLFERNLDDENMMNRYFNAHIIAFAMCDFGGLICIATNLFINENILFATIGLAVALVCIYFIFPKEKEIS